MRVSFHFSIKYNAVRSRVARLPKLVEGAATAQVKRDALNLIEFFQTGIRDNLFDLIPLADSTIMSKRLLEYTKPETPLYGAGDDEEMSYINMLRIKKVGTRKWLVFPTTDKHHKSSLNLSSLLEVHEQGMVISQTRHNEDTGESTEVLIRIPPRPAFSKAFKRVLRTRMVDARESTGKVRNAVRHLMLTGSDLKFKELKITPKESEFDET